MSAKTKPTQYSIYADRETFERYMKFRSRYPKVSDSAFFNAAMSFYLAYAERGIDANLQPYTLENGNKIKPEIPEEQIARAVEHYLAHKRHS